MAEENQEISHFGISGLSTTVQYQQRGDGCIRPTAICAIKYIMRLAYGTGCTVTSEDTVQPQLPPKWLILNSLLIV